MDRTQIMEQIAALDKQINQLTADNRVPTLDNRYSRFPLASWISAVVFFVLWVMKESVASVLPLSADLLGYVFLGLAVIIALFSLLRTFQWLFKGRKKVDKKYSQAMEKVYELQKQKEALQKQLKQTS